MGIHHDLTGLLSIRIQKPERAASLRPPSQRFLPSVANDQTAATGIIANVVGVVGELHRFQKLKCGPIVDLGSAVTSAGHEQAIGGSVVEQSLGLLEIRNRPQPPATLYVEHFDGVVPQRRNEYALTFQIDSKMVHASIDIWQGDAGFQRQ